MDRILKNILTAYFYYEVNFVMRAINNILKIVPLLMLLILLVYVISGLNSEREANKKYLDWKLSYYKRDVDLTPDDKTCTQFLICTILSAERPLDKSCSTILFKYENGSDYGRSRFLNKCISFYKTLPKNNNSESLNYNEAR